MKPCQGNNRHGNDPLPNRHLLHVPTNVNLVRSIIYSCTMWNSSRVCIACRPYCVKVMVVGVILHWSMVWIGCSSFLIDPVAIDDQTIKSVTHSNCNDYLPATEHHCSLTSTSLYNSVNNLPRVVVQLHTSWKSNLIASPVPKPSITAAPCILCYQLIIMCACLLCLQCFVPSVLWRCWLGGRKGIRPVKNWVWGAGVTICLEQRADLHMAQLMPLPLTVSCFSKIQIGCTFLVPACPGSPGQMAVKRLPLCRLGGGVE